MIILSLCKVTSSVPTLDEPYSLFAVNEDLTIKFNFMNHDTEIVFLVEAKVEGYVGFGFGIKMLHSDIIAIKFNGTNAPELTDCVGRDEVAPKCKDRRDPDKSES